LPSPELQVGKLANCPSTQLRGHRILSYLAAQQLRQLVDFAAIRRSLTAARLER
jgi:hypothetical protein